MPDTHDLKTLPEFFQQVLDGTKTAEVRVNDRDFKVGDVLNLREWDSTLIDCEPSGYGLKHAGYTGRTITKTIGGITDLSSFSDGYVLLSFAQASTPTGTDTPQVVPAREDVREAERVVRSFVKSEARNLTTEGALLDALATLTHAAQTPQDARLAPDNWVITHAYVGPIFRTAEGNEYGVCMRDDTIEVTPVGDAPAPRVNGVAAQTPPEVVEAWERYNEDSIIGDSMHDADFDTIDRYLRGER